MLTVLHSLTQVKVSNGALESKTLPYQKKKVSADVIFIDELVSSFNYFTDGYFLDQIFNIKCSLDALLTTSTMIYLEPKKLKSLAINVCSNVSGPIKLALLLIGKSKHRRCFREIDKVTLHVVHQNQKNAWVNTAIFNDWLQNSFARNVKTKLTELREEPKALLLPDNCLDHPNEDELVSSDGQIVARLLQLHITSLIRPIG